MDVAPLPVVAFTHDKFSRGAKNISDEDLDALFQMPFQQAFQTHHEHDSHFVTYTVPGQEEFPRLTKMILPRMRVLGSDVVVTMVVVDYDNPGHAPWPPGGVDEFLGKLLDVAATWPLAMAWTLFYATRGGARLVYVLDKPISVEQAEAVHSGIVREFSRHGIPMDEGVFDWTRLFRLPYVVRDKVPSWESNPTYIEQIDNRVRLQDLPTAAVGKANEYAKVEEFDEPKPSPDYARSLLWATSPDGKTTQTDFHTQAKRRLRNRECYPCIFDNQPLAAEGARDSTIHRHVGQAVGLLYYLEGARPEHIYALLLGAVEQLEPDNTVRDWTDVLWSAVGRNWAKEEAKAKVEQAKEAAAAERAADAMGSILEGMQAWCPSPVLRSDKKEEAYRYIERHMIASAGKAYYIMSQDGTFDPAPVEQAGLIAAIRARGMDSIIRTTTVTDNGVSDRPTQHIINQYATIVQEVWSAPAAGTARGGYIDHMDTANASLRIASYSRNPDIVPTYDADVDAWLKALFGPGYSAAVKWISWALAFEEGSICALSIKGPPGAGKKMLAQGLAECLTMPKLATADDLIGDYSYGLLQSPFLLVNEGWPKAGGGRHPADQFRALVSGDPLVVKRKFLAPTNVINPVRVLFTANNLDVIKLLSHKRELSPEDREALAVRLLHFNVTRESVEWLADHGGLRLTAMPGRRWIRSDGGEESNYIVAKHFLWLHQTRHQRGAVGQRFLVEGNANQEVLFELRTQAGSSPLVIEAILRMLELNHQMDGLAVVHNRLYVLASEVLNFYRKNMRDSGHGVITTDQISNVFRGLSVRESVEAFCLETRDYMGQRRWCELDTNILLDVARKDGWKCTRLEEIVKNRKNMLRISGSNDNIVAA